MMPMDPGGHHHNTNMPHTFPVRPMDLIAQQQQEQQQQQQQGYHSNNGGGGGSHRGESVPSGSGHPVGPSPHYFHGPPQSSWLESHPRGQGPHARPPPPNPNNNNGGQPRRSPRGNPGFRFDFPPPHHMHPHHARLSSGPGGNGGGGGGGGGPGGPSQGHHVMSQQRGGPSPRGGGPVGATRGPPAMRPLPPGAGGGGGGGPRRKPEHLHLVGPLGDPMFAGSSGACGGGGNGGGGGAGGCGGEGNLGMETVSRVLIPNCKIGAVIGKGGAIIKHIREVSRRVKERGMLGIFRVASERFGSERRQGCSLRLASYSTTNAQRG